MSNAHLAFPGETARRRGPLLLLATLSSIAAAGCCSVQTMPFDGPPVVGPLSSPFPDAAPERVRIAAIGDYGMDTARQAAIAHNVHRACADSDGWSWSSRPPDDCHLVILLGDNLYGTGIGGHDEDDDRNRLRRILDRYPTEHKYLVLGNHDYHPLFPCTGRARRQLAWIAESDNTDVYGTRHFYRFDAGPVGFWGLDTNYLVRNGEAANRPDLIRWLSGIERDTSPWKIVFGHHPFLSEGWHGHAGSFSDGAFAWPGEAFREVMARSVVGHADLYVSGHEHNLQFFPSALDEAEHRRLGKSKHTALAISGAAARCSSRGDAPSSAVTPAMTRYGYGFAIIDVDDEHLGVRYYDHAAASYFRAERSIDDPNWIYDESVDHAPRCQDEPEARDG